jgi:hypothetical protein
MRCDERRRVVLLEPDSRKFAELLATYAFKDRATCLNAFVGFDAFLNLDHLLEQTAIPTDFDVLSIDIDGNDFHVWAASTRYFPRLVVIEYNLTMSNQARYIQPARPDCSHSSSPLALVELGRQKVTNWSLLRSGTWCSSGRSSIPCLILPTTHWRS